jgi:hypothetical protein
MNKLFVQSLTCVNNLDERNIHLLGMQSFLDPRAYLGGKLLSIISFISGIVDFPNSLCRCQGRCMFEAYR